MQTEIVLRLRKALDSGELEEAITVAKSLDYIDRIDSLGIVRLLAREGDPRFDAYARRWLTRFVVEERASIGQVQVAVAALGALAHDPDSAVVLKSLLSVLPVTG